jgi:hypothetical protein
LFIDCINKTNDLILLFGQLFGNIPNDASTDEIVNSIIKYFENNSNFNKIIKQ